MMDAIKSYFFRNTYVIALLTAFYFLVDGIVRTLPTGEFPVASLIGLVSGILVGVLLKLDSWNHRFSLSTIYFGSILGLHVPPILNSSTDLKHIVLTLVAGVGVYLTIRQQVMSHLDGDGISSLILGTSEDAPSKK